ncbi:hypothetical protein [uncultured Nostoc sp.]|uniref:hypothetical protein n=1 Tax=uncultured Nostoc sp. TaxID=340711 RepID=UPI0035CC5F6B
MKKLPKHISESLSPVSLYLKDIELIEEIFKINCKSYTILTEEYELDSLEELKQLENLEFYKIRFQSQEPRVSLDISSLSTSIFISEDNAISTGILTKLKKILEPRIVPSVSNNYSLRANLNLMITIVSAFLGLQKLIIIDDFTSITISIVLLVLLITINSNLIFKSNADKLPVICTTNQTLKTNFLLEHKNQIRLLMIGGLITLVVQVLVQWIKEKILLP